jgi:hypothetical protein
LDSSPEKHVKKLINQARQTLKNLQIHRHDVDEYRALIRLEGKWHQYRIFITMIYRVDDTTRYSYHVLNKQNQHIHRYDNYADKTAIKLRHETDWKSHQHEETPHQHDSQGKITLTEPVTFEMFVAWLVENLPE